MDNLSEKYFSYIRSIIDQLYVDLDAIPDDTDTTAIREAIQRTENILHQYEK